MGLEKPRISPDEFDAVFRNEAEKFKRKLLNTQTPADWTTLFCRESRSLLRRVADRLGLQYSPEYFRIDAIMCHSIDDIHFDPGKWWAASHLSVVVEHENDPRDSKKEMNKLTIFDSPLKVLITYPISREQAIALLADYAKIVREADLFGDFGTKRKHLVIFGMDWDTDLTWESYTYRRREFVPLEVKP